MANLKEVRNRISSTQSTQQITKAMKLVSATKLRKAQDNINKMKPYSVQLQSILANLSGSANDDAKLKSYFEYKEPKNALIVVVSSDRGLCGGFNSNVVKAAKELINLKYRKNDVNFKVMYFGKKAKDNLKKENVDALEHNMGIFNDINAEKVFNVGQEIIDEFISGSYDEVEVIYNSFKNAATQIVLTEKLLPVQVEKFEEGTAKVEADYIFEPSKEEILYELVPRAIKTQLYKACLDSLASEHGARMVAMDKATENAEEIVDKLKLQYNQARQASITGEILEIVGGAAALDA
jgi:F-type H+-transporting ATPase subunit gamma